MIKRDRIIQIFKASPTPTSIVNADDPSFTFVQVNDAYTRMTQRVPEELIGKSLFEAFPENPEEKKPTGVEKLRSSFEKVIATRKSDEMETVRYDIVLDDGEFKEIYWKVINTPVLDEQGEVEFIINSATIITEQVLSERENNLMLNNTEDRFILIDRNLIIQNYNNLFAQNYKEIFGSEVKKGDSILDYAQPERREIVKDIYEQVFKGETIEGELPFKTPEGNTRYFSIKYKPAKDENNQIIGSFISLLEKTEEHVAKLELEKNEARFRALVENGSDVLFILNPDGQPTYISPSVENVLGYTQQEANEMDMVSIVHPEDVEIIFSDLQKCLEKPGEPIKVIPARMKHKNGEYRWFEGTITNMLHDPNINGIVDNFRDITERKKAERIIEEAKDQYQSLIQTVDGIVWEADAETFIFNFVSPQAKEILGYQPEEWIGAKGFWAKKIHPEDRADAINYCQHQTHKGINHSFEYRMQKADGEYIWMRDIVTVVHQKGKPASLRGLMMDINEKKKAERELENSLKNLAERVKEQRCLYEISKLEDQELTIDELLAKAVTIIPSGWQYPEIAEAKVSWNKSAFKTSGYKKTKWHLHKEFTRLQSGNLNIEIVYKEEKPSKDIGPFLIEEAELLNAIGEQLSLKIEQITQKKALDEHRQQMQRILDQSVDMICTARDGKFLTVSAASEEILGYKPEEMIGKYFSDFLVEEDTPSTLSIAEYIQDNHDITDFENRYYHKDGHIVHLTWAARWDERENKMYATARDATDLKAAQQAKEKERRNKEALINNTDDLIWSVDKNLNLITGNTAFLSTIEMQFKDGVKTGYNVLNGLDPKGHNYKRWKSYYERALNGETFRVENTDLDPEKGTETCFEISFNPIKENERIEGVACFARNITQFKKIQQKRLEAEKKYRNVVEYSTNMFYQHDTNGILNYVSPQSKKFLGYPPEEAMRKWTDFITDHPINIQGEKHTHKAIETGQIQPSFELQLKTADDRIIWVEVHEAPLIEDGKVTGIVGSLTDITERKKYEEQLHESLERYDYASKASRDAIYDWDILNDNLELGEGFKKLFGHEPGEGKYSIKRYFQSVHLADRDEAFEDLKFTLSDTSMDKWSYEYRFQKDDGRFAHVLENGYIIRNKKGKAIRMIGTLRDITEDKQAEIQTALQNEIAQFFKNEDRLNPILNNLLQYLAEFEKFNLAEIWLVSVTGTHLNLISSFARDGIGRKFYTESKDIKSFKFGEGLPGIAWKNKTIETQDNLPGSSKFVRSSAAKKVGLHSATALPLFHNQEVVGILLLGSEKEAEYIQNRIHPYQVLQDFLGAEIRRKQQEEEMFLLFESAPDILAIASPDNRFIRVNPAFCEILGYTKEEITSQNFENFLHPDDLEDTQKEFVETISGKREAHNFINRYITKSGETRWISWSSSEVFGEDGFAFAFGRDVTDRMELEQLLNQAQKMAKIGGWEVDLQKDQVYWSPMTKEIHEVDPDFEPDLATGINFYREGESRENIQRVINEAIEERKPFDVELQLVTGKGNIRWVRAQGQPETVNGKCSRIYGSLQDIHEKKELENLLKQTARLAKVGSWELEIREDKDDSMYWSEMTRGILEVPEDYNPTLTGGFEFYKEESKNRIQKAVENAISNGISFDEELQITTSKRKSKWIRCIGNAEFLEGKCVRIYGSFQDVTERKEDNLKLQKAYKEKENILESIDDGFFTVDKNWTVTYWNVQAERLLHTPKRKIIGQNLWDVFDDATDLASYTNYHRAMHQNVTVTFEDYYEPIDKWFDISAYPSAEGISVFFKDISERRKNEEKIRRINERFEKVTEATNDAIWDYDAVEEDLFWGKGFETLFGYDPKEINPTLEFLVSLIHPNSRERIMDKINKYMSDSTQSSWYEEYRFRKQDGSYAYVIDRANFIRNNKGEVVRVVGAMTDLTNQKKYEENLKKLNTQLEERAKELASSNEELEQFAYVASHDLQEPLRMVSSFLTQLEKKYSDQLDEKANQYIHFAVDGAQRMRQIILDLLNYSRLNQDKNIREEVDLNKALEEVILLERSHIEDKGAKLNVQELPTIYANPAAMKQVFKNLLNNALKYQEDGNTPEIGIIAEELDTHWKFTFKDNGIGIASDFQDNIFQIFHRLHTRDQYSGTGIGLAISKKIIERHGGQIWVESDEGKGSTFYFTIEK